ncbi:TraB/GumN family protein [Ralstonia soli]|uniref:TraB/GumN family protein n=1 Tax=Ralstonia soli TaxID=2953896 RepID=A0ABT1AEI2_9RALS|nr:TraB/GumN family protein [Ralstonia soli]MCO5396795.1 TraB/GumN family protein [Ralstonia soli]
MLRSFGLPALVRALATFGGAATLLSTPAIAQDGVPALAITAPNGAKSVLVATLHVPYPGLRQPAMSVLQGAKSLVIESSRAQGPQPVDLKGADLLDPNVFAGRATRASWAMALTDSQVDFLQQRAICASPQLPGLASEMLQHKSPRVAYRYAWTPCTASSNLSRDSIFAKAALRYNIALVPLEDQTDVESQRRAVPDRIYLRLLMSGLDNARQQEDFRQAVIAFNRGDYESIAALASLGNESPEDAAIFHRLMVHDRNLAWMPRLRKALDAGGAVVAVGAAHLPGPDGLVALLRADGYQVSDMVLPNDPALEMEAP